MYERKIPVPLACGLDLLREVMGGKWKISLLYFISEGLHRPSQLHRQLAAAPRRVLNLHLSQFIDHELVWKQTFPGRALKVEYHLTALGQSLLPLIRSLRDWTNIHQEQVRRIVAGLSDAPWEDVVKGG